MAQDHPIVEEATTFSVTEPPRMFNMTYVAKHCNIVYLLRQWKAVYNVITDILARHTCRLFVGFSGRQFFHQLVYAPYLQKPEKNPIKNLYLILAILYNY